MLKDDELSLLESIKQRKYEEKQAAWEVYADLRERCGNAYSAMQDAWQELAFARDEMNREYEKMQKASECYRQVWDEYGKIRDSNNDTIKSLQDEASSEHRQMADCFEHARVSYEYGDKSEAPVWSRRGYVHKKRRDELNCEIQKLGGEVKAAKQDAELRAPKIDTSAFYSAKTSFENAKSHYEAMKLEFDRLNEKRNQAKIELDLAKKEFIRANEEFKKKSEEVRTKKQKERDRVLDIAGVCWPERGDAKIVKRSDTTHVYYGGIDSADGDGHGHVVLDRFNNVIYERGMHENHGKQNYIKIW